MQMEPTLSPEENQDKLEQTGEEKTTTPFKEEVGQDDAAETKAASKTPATPKLNIAIDQLSLEEFPSALDKVLKNDQWMKLGQLVRDLQQQFDAQFLKLLQEKRRIYRRRGQ